MSIWRALKKEANSQPPFDEWISTPRFIGFVDPGQGQEYKTKKHSRLSVSRKER